MKMQNKNYVSFLIVAVFIASMFFLISSMPRIFKLEDTKYVKIAGKIIKVELAITQAEQIEGLSGHEPLREREGMLFIFPESGKYSFWMKDMNFPIDIIWLTPSEGGDASKARVIYIKKDARPELYPEVYGPEDNSKYVLEVVSGFSEKNNLQVGNMVEFTY